MDSLSFDGNGYPTDAALDELDNFEGTAAGFVAAADALYSTYGFVNVEEFTNRWDNTVKRVTFVTGGWSGNESVVSVIDRSVFHTAFWESSERGGRVVYEIPATMWESDGKWGGAEMRQVRRQGTLNRVQRELDRVTKTGEDVNLRQAAADAGLTGPYEWWQVLIALDNNLS